MRLWQEVDDRTVRLTFERFSAVVTPLNPVAGLHDIQVDGQPQAELQLLAAELQGVTSTDVAPATEQYLRGGDLVATYHDRPLPQVRSQIYWRANSHERDGAIAAVELVASVQTALLDGRPQFATCSRLLGGEAFRLTATENGSFVNVVPPSGEADPDSVAGAPHCYLFRLPGRQYSYAEMIHPADAAASSWDGWLHGTEFRLQLRHELFADRLEKGVILRARVLGILLDRRDDKAAAAKHWTRFLDEKLPLTT